MVFVFPLLLDALELFAILPRIIFIRPKSRRSLSADVNKFFMRINYDFVTIVGLINNLHTEKH